MIRKYSRGFPGGSEVKASACNVGDLGSIPELGRSPGEGRGCPLQYSGLENYTDYIIHGIAKSWIQLRDFHFTSLHFKVALVIKKLPANTRDIGDAKDVSMIPAFPWRREWHPSPLFLPGESHGQLEPGR